MNSEIKKDLCFNLINSYHSELLDELSTLNSPCVNKLKLLCEKFQEKHLLLNKGDKCKYFYNWDYKKATITSIYKPYYDDNVRIYDIQFDDSDYTGFYNVYSNSTNLKRLAV